ncbi:MAG: hypothetical protein ABIR17_04535 [Pseudolysinimonas sp.]|uniref:hypothetical protein n=1 Tax=Pseudolysinimonas sp. TaxID=2680009 RepID=UPI003264573A
MADNENMTPDAEDQKRINDQRRADDANEPSGRHLPVMPADTMSPRGIDVDDVVDDEGNDDWMADRKGVVPDADIVIPEADEEAEEPVRDRDLPK